MELPYHEADTGAARNVGRHGGLQNHARCSHCLSVTPSTNFDTHVQAEAVPSCFAFLGVRNESVGAVHGLHTPNLRVDEAALRLGASYLASVAAEFLRQQRDQS